MALRLLHASSSLHLFHDTDRDWLYLDWHGPLTLAAVQAGWLQLTRCLLERPYACILNSNAQVTHIDHAVGPWLLRGFERFLLVSGAQQVAWVYAHTPLGFRLAEGVAAALPLLNLSLFADEEQAVTWLEHYCGGSCPRSHSAEALGQLRQLVQALERWSTGQLVSVARACNGEW